MTEPRLVDDIMEEAVEVAVVLGVDTQAAQMLAQELVRRISIKWGGERHYIHAVTASLRAKRIAADPRPPKVVAQEHGVSVKTVTRIRARRVISGGAR